MSLIPDAGWYLALLDAVQAQQAGVLDRLGRPWAQHFERVALRTLFRNPAATRAQMEAALLHDAFMDRGGGKAMLASLGIGAETTEMIRITTPPSDADFYRDFEAIGPALRNVILYHIPGQTAVPLSPELVTRLRQAFPGVIAGIKDSSGDWATAERFLAAHGDIAVLLLSEKLLPPKMRGVHRDARGGVAAHDPWQGARGVV